MLLLDGATGTELERRGVTTPLPEWSAPALIVRPERVRVIHADYVRAGAEAVTANTFRTQRRALAAVGLAERAAELTGVNVPFLKQDASHFGADCPGTKQGDVDRSLISQRCLRWLEQCRRAGYR